MQDFKPSPFGERVMATLAKRQTSVTWLAVQCRVSHGTMYKILTAFQPSRNYVATIAAELKLDTLEMLRLVGYNDPE